MIRTSWPFPMPSWPRKNSKHLPPPPHVAASKEDYDTALYVAAKFNAAGLETQIVPYKAWLNLPQEVFLEATNAEGKILMSGPTREHVDKDPIRMIPACYPHSMVVPLLD